jgi:hypothetical protein
MTRIEILQLNIQDQNELISDLDLGCKRIEDLLDNAYKLITSHYLKLAGEIDVDEWLDKFIIWDRQNE